MKRYVLLLLTAVQMACAPLPAPEPHQIAEASRLVDQGTLYMRAGELSRARAAFEMAWEIGGAASALDGLGCVAFLEGDAERAEKLFVQAYQADENYSNSLANLALLYETYGLSQDAQALYERALAEDPENVRARNNLAGNLAEANPGRGAAVARAKSELLRASALVNHPLINHNIKELESTERSRR